MGNFNSYAKKINEIASEAFTEYQKAEQAYKRATEQAKQYPQRSRTDAQYEVRRARAQAELLETKEAFTAATKKLQSHNAEIAELRKKLVTEIDAHYAADPAQLDSSTLELLKSGILKANEYSNLMSKAQSSGNTTMCRMIAKYAGDAAEQRGSKYGQNDEQAQALRAISYTGDQNNGSDALDAFDVMAEVYNRTSINPAMISSWGELTSRSAEIL